MFPDWSILSVKKYFETHFMVGLGTRHYNLEHIPNYLNSTVIVIQHGSRMPSFHNSLLPSLKTRYKSFS